MSAPPARHHPTTVNEMITVSGFPAILFQELFNLTNWESCYLHIIWYKMLVRHFWLITLQYSTTLVFDKIQEKYTDGINCVNKIIFMPKLQENACFEPLWQQSWEKLHAVSTDIFSEFRRFWHINRIYVVIVDFCWDFN